MKYVNRYIVTILHILLMPISRVLDTDNIVYIMNRYFNNARSTMEKIITQASAARLLGVTPSCLHAWRKRGKASELKWIKCGLDNRNVGYYLDSVKEFAKKYNMSKDLKTRQFFIKKQQDCEQK